MRKSRNSIKQVVMIFSCLMKLLCIAFMLFLPALSVAATSELFPPADYLHSKLQQNDIVFLGTTHKKPEILSFIADLTPSLKGWGVSHIGLEIPSDQQEKIDVFMKTGQGLDDIKLHTQIDSPEYRRLFQVLRKSGGPIPVAIDLPSSMYKGTVSRDEWMARSLLIVLNRNLSAKILVIVGSLHTLKKLEWEDQVPNKHLSIREYITRERPSTKMWSIGQMLDGNPNECDFTRKFSSLPGAVALDLDDRYRGWQMGLTATIAIVPAECFELVDGLIVY
ncbi:hypothetical protein [Desulfosarcina sp.]|uniref:hypothetical protein n=1 Tax=Desulfosarcina sp. TaxID=2027861 RepID=UPI0029BD4523|nr:hypothetical protein [Desulfosarcina sp.]MDX2452515.1 hypothetical protein [Desulfosarcina sp.]MDX2490289.1 hypothetical protein [Desulfosarcina sp.]